ncbi:ABC transporter permease [Streptomyces sp. NBC_01231]|nr:ABC transporter permease [Streptomyces sp. NBC_01231]WSQ15288.1 ABC transporter permease [Streptomyces sp. NBC_01231]
MTLRPPVRRHRTFLVTAARYALVEHLRNRFAMVLMALFIPVWTALAFWSVPATRTRFKLRATGDVLTPAGNQLTEITGALNAVTLIIGFMMFAASFAGGHFDRRLALAGYPRTHLILAKLTALTLASATVALYATALTCAFWRPEQPALLAAALFSAGITYGALGVAFGSLLRREVEGMFAIVMTSVIDLALQNPLYSASSDSAIVRYLPSYGAMQAATGAGFSSTPLPKYLAIQAAWFAAAALVALLSFHFRTRNSLNRRPQPHVIAPHTADVPPQTDAPPIEASPSHRTEQPPDVDQVRR